VPLAGVTWSDTEGGELDLPTSPYWIEVDFTKRFGTDFPCALTFPAAGAHISLVLGGWGGTVCGLSCLDGEDASRNPTRFLRAFPPGVRTALRMEVRDAFVRAWLDGQLVVDVDLTGREVSVRAELLPSRPLGLAAFATAVDFHRVCWGDLQRMGPE